MKKIQPAEKEFSKWFRQNFDGWCERVEPSLGVASGFPDLLCLMPSGLLPVELKIGSLIDGVVWSSEIRPSQISWHRNFANKGGSSCVAVGVWQGRWRLFMVNGVDCSVWNSEGFPEASLAIEIDAKNLFASLAEYQNDYLEI